jgi:hypothetical protein
MRCHSTHWKRTYGSLIALAAQFLILTHPVQGQIRSIPGGTSESELVANAHAEGNIFPRAEIRREPYPDFAAVQNGSAERRCVEGTEKGPIRSGEFVIGGQLQGSVAMPAGQPGKIWWSPLNHSMNMPPLEVRGRSLVEVADTLRFTTGRVGWPSAPGAPPVPEAEREYFFPSGITLPKPGRWLVIATSGENWGCFIVAAKVTVDRHGITRV